MSNDNVKAWLWGYRDAVRECRRLTEEYNQLVASQAGPKAVEYDGMPKTPGEPKDLSALMEARETFYQRACTASAKASRILTELAKAVDVLPVQLQREIISLRYLQLVDGCPLSWVEIADKTGYSEKHVLDVHGDALRELARIARPEESSD